MTRKRITKTTMYMIEWQLPNGEKRFNRAELYEHNVAAVMAAECLKQVLSMSEIERAKMNAQLAQIGMEYRTTNMDWAKGLDYDVVPVAVRRTVKCASEQW